MRTLTRKLRSRRGETLVEVLAAVLVCTLSVLLLASASVAAGRINHTAAEQDETYYEALNHAEARVAAPGTGTLTVTVDWGASEAVIADSVTIDVSLYGNEGAYSFAAAASPTPGPGEGGEP